MKQRLVVLIALLLTPAYVGRPVKGDDTPKEQTYARVFYCFNTQSVLDQRQSGKHKIIVGYLLSPIDPRSEEMKACAKDGVLMMGYVQITPPFASPDEGVPTRN